MQGQAVMKHAGVPYITQLDAVQWLFHAVDIILRDPGAAGLHPGPGGASSALAWCQVHASFPQLQRLHYGRHTRALGAL